MAVQPQTLTYEAALQELEDLIHALENGQLALDDLFEGYKRGAELLKFCQDRLAAVQNQIRVVQEENPAEPA